VGVSNSQFQIYLDLMTDMIREDPARTSPLGTLRDVREVTQRASHEGLPFLTKTLPSLGRSVLTALEQGQFVRPPEFKARKRMDARPAFMFSYFEKIFDDGGVLRTNACPRALRHVMQVCFWVYKLEVPYSKSEEERVIAAFLDTEAELSVGLQAEASPFIERAIHIAKTVFEGFDPKDIAPRHGPGAVATGEKSEGKWIFHRLYDSIHQVFPYYDYFMVGRHKELIDRLDWYKGLHRVKKRTG